MRVELLAVARDDAGRLLPAVLQRVQAEVGHVRGLGVAEDAEDAALVVEVVVLQRSRSDGAPGGASPDLAGLGSSTTRRRLLSVIRRPGT